MLQHDRHVWPYDTVPQEQLDGKPRGFRSGKVLGGGSSINAMCYVRGQPRDYEAWQEAVGDAEDWSYKEMLRHFLAQENNDTFHNEFHNIEGGLAVQLPQGINKLNQYCLKAFQEYGLPYNPDYNGSSQIGVSPVQSTVGDYRRCSAADAYLGRHLRSRRVTLLTNTTVTRVLVAGGVAVGVECVEGHVVNTIRVGQVILSAGAIHTPKILKCSGIGPEEELRRFDIEVAANSPEVGENLQDHPLVPVRAFCKGDLGYQAAAHGLGTIKAGLRYLITKSGPAAGNGIETVSYWDPDNFDGDPTIQCYHVPIIISHYDFSPTGGRAGVTFDLAVLQPLSRGWIRLADSNPTSTPRIHPNFMGHEQDLQRAVRSVKAIREVMRQESLRDIIEEEIESGPANQTDEELAGWVKRVATTMWHPIGTCRMGNDDRAVVDASFRVNGVKNLRVIDASIMPNITSGNTNAPTQALARHGAELFVRDCG
jgi:choline dehydrogenase